MKVLLTVAEFAEATGYSARSIHDKVAEGVIDHVRLGDNGRIRIPIRVVRDWIDDDDWKGFIG